MARCSTTGKVIYTSRAKAERALHKAIGGKRADQHAYRCDDYPSHWHLGHNAEVPKRATYRSGGHKWTAVEWDQATMLLWGRCRGLCEWCGQPLGNNLERHHRQVKEVGGDRLANLVALHSACHVPQVHAHPELARERGAIVSRHAPDPAVVPLQLPDGRAVLLTDDGHYTAA